MLELLGTCQCTQTETLQGNHHWEKAPEVLALVGMALEVAQGRALEQVQVVGCKAGALVLEQPGR